MRPGIDYTLRLVLPDGTFSNKSILTRAEDLLDRILYHIQLYLTYIPPSNKALEGSIFDFYLCILSEALKLPHSRLKFLTRPSASCQNYMENPLYDLTKPSVKTKVNWEILLIWFVFLIINCKNSLLIKQDSAKVLLINSVSQGIVIQLLQRSKRKTRELNLYHLT